MLSTAIVDTNNRTLRTWTSCIRHPKKGGRGGKKEGLTRDKAKWSGSAPRTSLGSTLSLSIQLQGRRTAWPFVPWRRRPDLGMSVEEGPYGNRSRNLTIATCWSGGRGGNGEGVNGIRHQPTRREAKEIRLYLLPRTTVLV